MKQTVLLAICGIVNGIRLRQQTVQAPVDMDNTQYLSSMTLVQWKLFSEDERYDLYKQSEDKVGNYTATISNLELDNTNDRATLASAQAEVQKAKDDVEKI